MLGEVAREYGLAGAVQHGASTLPDELFHRFPQVETAEIHLATGFQNALYEHEAFPAELYAEIEALLLTPTAPTSARTARPTTQFVYKTRKKALGQFKRQLWDLETQGRHHRQPAGQDALPLRAARHPGNRAIVERFVSVPVRHTPAPASLQAVALRS